MNSKSFLTLGVLALVAVVAVVVISNQRQAITERSAQQRLFADLDEGINNVERVTFRSAQSADELTLVKRDDVWTVEQRGGYPADMNRLRSKLIGLVEAEKVRPMTRSQSGYGRLGVEDLDTEASRATELVLTDAGGEEKRLLIGDTSSRGAQLTYVRTPGEEQSWAVSGDLSVDTSPTGWLDRDVINIPAGEIRSIVITQPDGSALQLSKSVAEDVNFVIDNLPPDREALAPTSGNSVANALASVRLDDVVAETAFEAPDVAPVIGRFETWDGLVVNTRAWKIDDTNYLAISADGSADDDGAKADDSEPEGVEAGDEVEEAQPAPGAAERAAVINATTGGWVYTVPSYKHSNITKTLGDLLKPLDDEAEDDPEAG